jgi:hypothetical protein
MSDPIDDFDPAAAPRFPPTDESGEVDLTLIDDALSKTVAQRFEDHYAARMLAEALRRGMDEYYGSTLADDSPLD